MAGKPEIRGGPGIDWSGATILRMGRQHAPSPFPVPLGGVAAVKRTPSGEPDDLRMSNQLGLKMTRSTLYPPFSRIEDGHDSGKYGEWSLRDTHNARRRPLSNVSSIIRLAARRR